MRFLATLLTALSLPLYAFAAHHGEHLRRHADVAVRARGDLAERGNNYRFTYYDVTVGMYVPTLCPHFLCLIFSTVHLVVEDLVQTTL
jgi:hypothetical protein